MWTYTFYRAADYQSPVTEFIDGQEPRITARMYGALEKLAEVNVRLGPPHTEYIEGWDFWELKEDIEEVVYSMFYFPFEGRKYVVVHAIRKRESQETPTEDLNTAKQLMEDYIDRA